MENKIYIDDTNIELDMALITIPYKFRDLFAGRHFATMQEFNDDLRVASICASGHHFGWCMADKNALVKRLENRKKGV